MPYGRIDKFHALNNMPGWNWQTASLPALMVFSDGYAPGPGYCANWLPCSSGSRLRIRLDGIPVCRHI